MQHNSNLGNVRIVACLVYFLFGIQYYVTAQCLTKKNIWDSLSSIEKNSGLQPSEMLQHYYSLKFLADKCNIQHDSVYGKILFKIASTEIKANKNYSKGLKLFQTSLNINAAAKKGCSKYLTTANYFNIAFYYDELGLYNKALDYYDSTIVSAKTFPDTTKFILNAQLYKTNMLFRIGDYQNAIEEGTIGISYSINKKDSLRLPAFLIQRAQAFYYINNLNSALSDINNVIKLADVKSYAYDLASAIKLKAYIFAKQKQFNIADSLFNKMIGIRIQTNSNEQIANDYIDYGNFLSDSLKEYAKALNCYEKTILYADKAQNPIANATANINISAVYLSQKKLHESAIYCNKTFESLDLNNNNDINAHISADKLNEVGDNYLLLFTMTTKIEILLNFFFESGSEKYLNDCLKDCLITDTIITKMRNAQTGVESKLYWRDYTRDFYTNAIEVCYLLNKADYAFYFTEKSRAVLLNDKLNELNASSYLSKTDAAKQEYFEIQIVELQQKLSVFTDTAKQYQTMQLQLINVKNEFEQFIKSLDKNYPAYYQYKYADDVPSLKDLQQYLAKNNQSFVHYFVGDTVTYILAITASNTKLIRLSQKEFNKEQLTDFLQLCADKQALNNHYDSFARLSNSIYKLIFQSLQLSKGRIVICSDNIVIPFDALCTDTKGKRFLLNDYSFSYVYAARFLMKQFNNPAAKGNFAGFAPVSFEKYLGVVDLKNAAEALHASASYYKSDKLFTKQNASRSNFFKYASSYSIVSIFSHARADTTDNEPVLFMQDSVIHLSELQLLNDPATKLVLLSACQTNVGKAATGEGIYSLARGFATAGIPSVAATLWKADEQTIYAVSEKFNEYLSGGMNKDEALQKAKLYFIQNNNSEKMLPYYWANMILIGNTDAINLTTPGNNYWWWIAGCCFIVLGAVIAREKIFLNIKNKNE